MSVRRALVAMVVLLIFPACSKSAEVRFRVTVVVDDNGHRYSGSGVWSSRQIRPALPIDYAYGNEFHGDAITVKLPGRGLFFLVPQGPRGEGDTVPVLAEQLFYEEWKALDTRDRVEIVRYISHLTGATRVAPCDYSVPSTQGVGGWRKQDLECLMTAFTRNPADRHAIVSVPKGRVEDIIGKGVRVRSVSITITNDKVTRTISDVLPWLANIPTPDQRAAEMGKTNDDIDEVYWMRR